MLVKKREIQEDMSLKEKWLNLLDKIWISLVLVGMCSVLSIMTPYFLTITNIINVIRQSSIIAFLGIGMTFVIIMSGIDLSVGSVMALSGVVCVHAIVKWAWPILPSIFLGLAVSLICGSLLNGLLVTKVRLPPFIATLAVMNIARGLTLVITGGRPIFGVPEAFEWLGEGYIGIIPVPIILMVIAYIIFDTVLRRTHIGTYDYAIGGNEEAARLAGINVNRYKVLYYTISGFTAGCAGIILVSRLSSAQPLLGLGYEFDAIAAAVIGGVSLLGGEGTLVGTLVGALMIGVLRNGLNLLDVSTYWQQVVIGIVIATAVAIDVIRETKRAEA